MQNLNDLNKVQQAQTVQEIPNQESAGKPAPSKFGKIMGIVWFFASLIILIFVISIIVKDNSRTRKQIEAGAEAALNSPKIQAQLAQEAKRQREFAKQRRLKQLGIDGISEPTQKNDLLNQQLKRQEIAEEQEKAESQKPQEIDYRSELAAYNARLKEVKEQEERLRAEAAAAAQAQAQAQAALE